MFGFKSGAAEVFQLLFAGDASVESLAKYIQSTASYLRFRSLVYNSGLLVKYKVQPLNDCRGKQLSSKKPHVLRTNQRTPD
jgi:hypothetical protein